MIYIKSSFERSSLFFVISNSIIELGLINNCKYYCINRVTNVIHLFIVPETNEK